MSNKKSGLTRITINKSGTRERQHHLTVAVGALDGGDEGYRVGLAVAIGCCVISTGVRLGGVEGCRDGSGVGFCVTG